MRSKKVRGLAFLVACKPYTANKALGISRWARVKCRNEVKEATREALDGLLSHLGNNDLPLDAVHIEASMQYKRKGNFCDTDAPAPMLKAVIDTLVYRGVIIDDTGDIVKSVKYLPPTGGCEVEGLLVWVNQEENAHAY